MPNFKSQTELRFKSLGSPEASQVSVGGVGLEPVPFISLNREEFIAGQYVVGGALNLSLDGFIYGSGFSSTSSGITTLLGMASNSAANGSVTGITVKCGSTNIIENGIGRVESINFDQGPQRNWMNVIPYNIELQIYETGGKPVVTPHSGVVSKYGVWDGSSDTAPRGISNISENYTLNLDENAYYHPLDGTATHSNRHITLDFNVSVEGATSMFNHHQYYGLKGANQVLTHLIKSLAQSGLNSLFMDSNHASFDLATAGFSSTGRLSTLSYSVDELNNSASMNGQILYLTSGNDSNCLVSMDMDHNNSIDSADEGFTVNGQIQGLGNQFGNTGGDILSLYNNGGTAAMDNAEAALDAILFNSSGLTIPQDLVSGVRNRSVMANHDAVGELGSDGRTNLVLNVASQGYAPTGSALSAVSGENANFRLVGKTVKRNYNNNTIDFSLTYNNKRFKIPDALWAEINVDHQGEFRRLAEHVVPGRGYPITQDINCSTLETFTLTLTAQLEPLADITVLKNNAGPSSASYSALLAHASGLGCADWALTQDDESFNNNGVYRRTQQYTKTSCNRLEG